MKSFNIKNFNKRIKLTKEIIIEDGFKYKMKSSHLGVKEIIILNPNIIDELIFSNFNRHYKKILEYYLTILQNESDSSEGNFMIALDEITRLRNILIKRYNAILSKKMAEKMLKKLKILENEIRMKVIDIRLIKEKEYAHTIKEPEECKSR